MNTTYKLELNSKPKKDNTHLILLRITQNKKHKRITTGIFISKDDWNIKKEFGKWIRRSNSKYKQLNQDLEDRIQDAKNFASELSKKKESIAASNIITSIKEGNTESTESFIKYFEHQLSKFYDSHSAAFYKNASAKLRKLKLYLKEIKKDDLLFIDLNVKFLNDYEHWLLTKRQEHKQGLNSNTRIGHLKILRSILYKAIDEDLYEGKNPFRVFKIAAMKGNKTKLTIEEIRKIENLELPKDSKLWHTKNYFLFDFYNAGIRIEDLMQLKWNNIKEGRLDYVAQKTKKNHSIKLLQKANAILNFYKTSKQKADDFIFPILDDRFKKADKHFKRNLIDSRNASINLYLKTIQEMAKIDTNISCHIGRHSFANILKQRGVDTYDIKNLLGHSTLKQTEDYLDALNPITSDKAHKEALESI